MPFVYAYSAAVVALATGRGYSDAAHRAAIAAQDEDGVSLTHPFNWLTEEEVEAVVPSLAQDAIRILSEHGYAATDVSEHGRPVIRVRSRHPNAAAAWLEQAGISVGAFSGDPSGLTDLDLFRRSSR